MGESRKSTSLPPDEIEVGAQVLSDVLDGLDVTCPVRSRSFRSFRNRMLRAAGREELPNAEGGRERKIDAQRKGMSFSAEELDAMAELLLAIDQCEGKVGYLGLDFTAGSACPRSVVEPVRDRIVSAFLGFVHRCPKCGTEGTVGEAFGVRRMRSGDGSLLRCQSQCKTCRNVSARASAEAAKAAKKAA